MQNLILGYTSLFLALLSSWANAASFNDTINQYVENRYRGTAQGLMDRGLVKSFEIENDRVLLKLNTSKKLIEIEFDDGRNSFKRNEWLGTIEVLLPRDGDILTRCLIVAPCFSSSYLAQMQAIGMTPTDFFIRPGELSFFFTEVGSVFRRVNIQVGFSITLKGSSFDDENSDAEARLPFVTQGRVPGEGFGHLYVTVRTKEAWTSFEGTRREEDRKN